MITAKVKCYQKTETGVGADRQVQVGFNADYANGRNKEWSLYTPALSLSMTLKGEVADRFAIGTAYTLQLVESED
jgi:predicted RNA-binding protein with PIN domain